MWCRAGVARCRTTSYDIVGYMNSAVKSMCSITATPGDIDGVVRCRAQCEHRLTFLLLLQIGCQDSNYIELAAIRTAVISSLWAIQSLETDSRWTSGDVVPRPSGPTDRGYVYNRSVRCVESKSHRCRFRRCLLRRKAPIDVSLDAAVS